MGRLAWVSMLAGAALAAPANPNLAALVDQADMNTAVTATPNPAGAGSAIAYTIKVVNSGPTVALSPSVGTTVPGHTRFTSFTAPSGWTVTAPPAGGTGAIGAVRPGFASGATATFTLVVTVEPGTGNDTVVTMSASSGSRVADPNPGNNRADVSVQVLNTADLVVAAVDSPDPVGPGGTLSYTLGVANAGPALATSLSLTTNIPGSTVFASFVAPAGWSVTTPAVGGTGTITATRPDLASGATATFTLTVTVDAGTAAGTTISLTTSGNSATADNNNGNNSATVSTAVAVAADLAVTASGVPSPVSAGGTITYTVAVKNSGPVAAASAALSALVPANTAFASFTAPEGWTARTPPAGGTGTITATRPTLPAGTSAAFTLVVTVNPGTADGAAITLTANTAASTTDPNPGNNSSTANVDVSTATPGEPAPTQSEGTGRTGGSLPSAGSPNIRLIGLTTLIVGAGLLLVLVASTTMRRRREY